MRQIALEQRQPAPLDLSEQTITYARRSTLRLCPRALVMPLAELLSTVSLAFAGGIRAGHGLILRAELAKEHD